MQMEINLPLILMAAFVAGATIASATLEKIEKGDW